MKKIILTYTIVFLLFSITFLSLFLLIKPSFQQVLFYRGLFFLITTTIFFLGFSIYFHFKNIFKLDIESLIAAILISASFHLSFFVVFPVTFERSITMFLLNTLEAATNQQCQGLTRHDLEQKLTNEYVIDYDALGKRIREQKVINFLEDKGECVKITPKARKFLDFSKIIQKVYSLK